MQMGGLEYLQRPKEGPGHPGAGVTSCCKLPGVE